MWPGGKSSEDWVEEGGSSEVGEVTGGHQGDVPVADV